MGQLCLADLDAIGRATVRGLRWLRAGLPEQLESQLDVFLKSLSAVNGDQTLVTVAPPSELRAGGGSWSYGSEPDWSIELWLPDERDEAKVGAGWYIGTGYRNEFFLNLNVRKEFERDRLEVRLEPDHVVRGLAWSISASAPGFLRWGLANKDQFPDGRRVIQALDGYMRSIPVKISRDWVDNDVRESVMSQVAEFCVRVAQFEHARAPTLAADVFGWWSEWASRVARRPKAEEVSAGELFELASRSVRPAYAAGHRLYWRKSLESRSETLLLKAAGEVGISRRAAYDRLRRAEVKLGDFAATNDPLTCLVRFLQSQAPSDRLPAGRKVILELLCEAGMTESSARKLERRIRTLPELDQRKRLEQAMHRAAKQTGRPI